MAVLRKIKKVLLVDDDCVLTVLLTKCLTDNGFEVTALSDAAHGLEYAMARHPDLVVLDVMMPIINGYNFCRFLKQEEGQKDIIVVLLTSRDQLKDIEIGLDAGADAYLTKPVNTDELLKTIRVLESMQT